MIERDQLLAATPFQTIKSLLFGSIIGPLVMLLVAVAFIYFLFGVARYIVNAENPEARQQGARHMFFGIIGLSIMLSAFAIGLFIFNSVTTIGGDKGFDGKDIDTPSILKPENQGF